MSQVPRSLCRCSLLVYADCLTVADITTGSFLMFAVVNISVGLACCCVCGVQVNQQIPTDGDCYGVAADITAIQSDTSWR